MRNINDNEMASIAPISDAELFVLGREVFETLNTSKDPAEIRRARVIASLINRMLDVAETTDAASKLVAAIEAHP